MLLATAQTLTDSPDVLIARNPFNAVPGKHKLSLLRDFYVEPGTIEDWRALQELHYKGHSLAAGANFMRCVYQDGEYTQLAGVMVFCNGLIHNAGRNEVFPHMMPNRDGRDTKLMNQLRNKWMNKNIIWMTRMVVDTMFRSAGVGYRFKNLANRIHCSRKGYRYVEMNSSMSKFNPFALKAGESCIRPKSSKYLQEGLVTLQGLFKSPPADIVGIKQELEAMPEARRAFVERQLRMTYYRMSSMEKSGDKRDLGTSRVETLPMDYVFKQLLHLIFSSTVYSIWKCPDEPGSVPDRLPLLAFDLQGPNEPLNQSQLKELLPCN